MPGPTPRDAAFIPFSPPSIGADEIAEVVATLRSDWITTGPRVAEFERRFAEHVGAEDAAALNSCTAGLQLALVLSGVGPGDAVITTPLTFAGTVNVIAHVGATPVLADVSPDTLNLDPEAVRAAVAEARAAGLRPRVVLAVHYAGHPCDTGALDALADEHGLRVVEDAAHALPAAWRGRPVGAARGRVLTAFSFYANKNLTTGEGGMLTGPRDLVERARLLRNSGISRDPWRRGGPHASWRYEVREPGWKFNMTDIAAAIGLHQLARLPAFDARRHAIAARYTEAFAGHPGLQPPSVRPGARHAWHLYPLRLRVERLALDRDAFVEALDARGIGASVHFIPIHRHPAYAAAFAGQTFPVAEDAFRRLVSLPVHPRLADDDVARVVAAVRELAAVRPAPLPAAR